MCFLILIVSTIFSYVYLGACTKVSLTTNISTSIFNNNIIDYKDNEITIEYSNLNNYLIRVNKYYDLKDTMSLIENNSYNATMTKNDNKYIYTATLSKDVVKKYFNNYFNEKETKINIKTDMSIKYDDKLYTIDVSKSKNINDLSPKEMQKLMEQTATIFPTILGMINQSSNNTFLAEIKSIYSSARKQFTLDDLNNSVKGDVTYSNIEGCSGKTLDVDFKEVAYSITLDKEGNIKAFNVYNGVYVFEKTNIKDISDITLDKIDYEYDYAITKCTK